jgi:hypothetical protein
MIWILICDSEGIKLVSDIMLHRHIIKFTDNIICVPDIIYGSSDFFTIHVKRLWHGKAHTRSAPRDTDDTRQIPELQ